MDDEVSRSRAKMITTYESHIMFVLHSRCFVSLQINIWSGSKTPEYLTYLHKGGHCIYTIWPVVYGHPCPHQCTFVGTVFHDLVSWVNLNKVVDLSKK